MYGLFYSLVLSFFYGQWTYRDTSAALSDLSSAFPLVFKPIGSLFRNIALKLPDSFSLSDSTSFIGSLDQDLTDKFLLMGVQAPRIIASVIALIVTIGIVMVTIKAIKSIFRVFLGGRLV